MALPGMTMIAGDSASRPASDTALLGLHGGGGRSGIRGYAQEQQKGALRVVRRILARVAMAFWRIWVRVKTLLVTSL